MIDAKKELQYRLAVRMLEHLAEIGLLSAEELVYAKRLAGENTPRRLFGNSSGYSADRVVACVLTKKIQGSEKTWHR